MCTIFDIPRSGFSVLMDSMGGDVRDNDNQRWEGKEKSTLINRADPRCLSRRGTIRDRRKHTPGTGTSLNLTIGGGINTEGSPGFTVWFPNDDIQRVFANTHRSEWNHSICYIYVFYAKPS